MKILAIETSCDETAVSIIEKRGSVFTVLSNIVSSQAKLHAVFGGVVPNLANREHQKNLVPVLIAALKEAKLYQSQKKNASTTSILQCIEVLARETELAKYFSSIIQLAKPAIDTIAVTEGPGLEPALWVGINFAKALAVLWNKPLIPINHMEGHIFSALIKPEQKRISNSKFLISKKSGVPRRYTLYAIRYPAVALLVSGGHTELIRIKKLGRYSIIGETLDDAAGEAFDKVAKMLGLGYPGGPAISKIAERGDADAIVFPRPMINAQNFNFSFSGLKTAVLYHLRDHPHTKKSDVAASFQQAAIDVLVAKTMRAIKKADARTLIVGGGVAANKQLRMRLQDACSNSVALFLPDASLTGDNALMIALAAFFGKKKSARNIRADGNMKLGPRKVSA